MSEIWTSSFLLLLIQLFFNSSANICLGVWELQDDKMVVEGSLSTNPPRPFVIDFYHFTELGQFSH